MRRRDLLGTIVSAAAAWPLRAHAQQGTTPVIGFLNGISPDAISRGLAGFHRGLAEGGYVENQNLLIEYRWAHGQYDTVPTLARELVSRNVAAVAAFGPPATQAMKAATSTIPFVFSTGEDVVKTGLVASVSRPGGNATGVNLFTQAVAPKRLELLDEIIPKGAAVGFLLNPSNPGTQGTTVAVEQAARMWAGSFMSGQQTMKGRSPQPSQRSLSSRSVGLSSTRTPTSMRCSGARLLHWRPVMRSPRPIRRVPTFWTVASSAMGPASRMPIGWSAST